MNTLSPGIGDLQTPFKDEANFEIRSQPEPEVQIPVEASGTGIEQLLMLGVLLFGGYENGLLLIEEPENHLHPGAQEKLVQTIAAQIGGGYCFLTTHSPVLIQSAPGAVTVNLRRDADGRSVGESVSSSRMGEVMDNLGIRGSHLLLADMVVLVEGVTAVGPVEEWLGKWPDLNDLRDTVRIVVHHVDVSDFQNEDFEFDKLFELNRNIVLFFDRDEHPATGKESVAHDALEKACKDKPVPYVRLKTVRSLEHLFPDEAVLHGAPPDEYGWSYDPDGAPAIQQLHAQLGKRGKPKRLNRRIAGAMTVEGMKATDEVAELMDMVTCIAKQIASSV